MGLVSIRTCIFTRTYFALPVAQPGIAYPERLDPLAACTLDSLPSECLEASSTCCWWLADAMTCWHPLVALAHLHQWLQTLPVGWWMGPTLAHRVSTHATVEVQITVHSYQPSLSQQNHVGYYTRLKLARCFNPIRRQTSHPGTNTTTTIMAYLCQYLFRI